MPPPAARTNRCSRLAKRLCGALWMVLALAATLGLLSSLIGIQHGPDIQSSAQQHAVSATPSLFEGSAADMRQATTIDWRSCLAPDDAESPMEKQAFLQQVPSRCRPKFKWSVAERVHLLPLQPTV